ncbi:MAG: competence/damage-inducible protein A [Candidatus Zixiibacteriota bacterium]|nr:MAG: competence/damage-inducible protein A [candidate division Zixibacteria bacterium]
MNSERTATTEILTIGDEVLMGQVVNTNAAWLGEILTREGVSVDWMTTVGDHRDDILEAFGRAASRAKAVIITGGLGPTPDDLTKPLLAEFLGDALVFRDDLLARVQKRFADRGMEMPPASRNQAEFPAGAQVIPNANGTAAGIHYSRGGIEWFSLPGVPLEMKPMVEDYVLPRLREVGLGKRVAVRLLRTVGIGESHLMQKMTRLGDAGLLVEIAFLPKYFGVDLRLTARGGDPADLQRRLDQAETLLLPDLEPHLYARGEESLVEVTGLLARERGWMIAAAESCTGGLIAKLFTDVPGSSEFFERGVVTYSNRAKTELLGVSEELIARHGAVSEPVARAMAEGLLDYCPADLAVSVTGIAGPAGGTAEKPVGLVYLGVAERGGDTQVEKFLFKGDRDMNRQRSAMAAVRMLWERLRNVT